MPDTGAVSAAFSTASSASASACSATVISDCSNATSSDSVSTTSSAAASSSATSAFSAFSTASSAESTSRAVFACVFSSAARASSTTARFSSTTARASSSAVHASSISCSAHRPSYGGPSGHVPASLPTYSVFHEKTTSSSHSVAGSSSGGSIQERSWFSTWRSSNSASRSNCHPSSTSEGPCAVFTLDAGTPSHCTNVSAYSSAYSSTTSRASSTASIASCIASRASCSSLAVFFIASSRSACAFSNARRLSVTASLAAETSDASGRPSASASAS